MHQTLCHATWRISRRMTVWRGPQPDIAPKVEVRAAMSPPFTSLAEP